MLSWAEAGWVSASVDYRLQSSEAAGAQPIAAARAVEDVGDALRWLIDSASEYGVDTNRIVAMGGSAGGFTVLPHGLVQHTPRSKLSVSRRSRQSSRIEQ